MQPLPSGSIARSPQGGSAAIDAPVNSRWLVPLGSGDASGRAAGGEDHAAQLICFPFAGGGASSFRAWRTAAAARKLDLVAVQYPGRETRWGEPTPHSLAAMAASIATAITEMPGRSLILFGHSFGALVALETARRLVAAGETRLARVVVSGARAPGSPRPDDLHDLPEHHFLERVTAFGGMPPAVAQSAELMALALPVLRADFRMMELHETGDTTALPVPMSVFGGREDTHVPLATLFGWQSETSRSARLRLFGGGHFFPFEGAAQVLDAIADDSMTISP